VAHQAAQPDELRYASRDAGGWRVETVDTSVTLSGTSLALDGGDWAHVAYATESEIAYAYQDGSAWQIESVRSLVPGSVVHFSLALDTAGAPHLAYFCAEDELSTGFLGYAHRDTTGWQFRAVTYPEWPVYLSIAVDDDGLPHISYTWPREISVSYLASADAGHWSFGYVDEAEMVDSAFTSLALSADGQAHVLYGNVGNVRHAWGEGSTWQAETLDQVNDAGYGPSLVSPGAGRAQISFYDLENLALLVADPGVDDRPTVVTSPVWPGETPCSSLALDSLGRLHLLYDVGGLWYAWQDESGWSRVGLRAPARVNVHPSLALDDQDQPHLAYIWADGQETDLEYALYDGESWHSGPVGEEGQGRTSLALDDAGYPHISYEVSPTLRYAYEDAIGWHWRTVDAAGSDGSLALDDDGWPHIAYVGATTLMYAWQDASGWHGEAVLGEQGEGPSLALDAAGRLHASYCEAAGPALKHAYRDASGWHAEVVDAEAYCAGPTSLAVDAWGDLHVAYRDAANHDLKYATTSSVRWDHVVYLPVVQMAR
jgi:hypothetical protein